MEQFFRNNYIRMVRYCSSMGFDEADVEEEVSDVIFYMYEEYKEKITEAKNPESTMRHWMSRRVMLNLKSRYINQVRFSRTEMISEDILNSCSTLDTPEAILDIKQRMPTVHPLLVSYESFRGGQRTRGKNTSADTSRFFLERKKLMAALAA